MKCIAVRFGAAGFMVATIVLSTACAENYTTTWIVLRVLAFASMTAVLLSYGNGNGYAYIAAVTERICTAIGTGMNWTVIFANDVSMPVFTSPEKFYALGGRTSSVHVLAEPHHRLPILADWINTPVAIISPGDVLLLPSIAAFVWWCYCTRTLEDES